VHATDVNFSNGFAINSTLQTILLLHGGPREL
jgi:hypothetical protein